MIVLARALAADQRGGNAAEFAIVSPVLFVMMMGLGDLAFQGYAQAVLTGAVQKAGRDQTLQKNSASTDAMDQMVENAISAVVPRPVFNARSSRRSNYDNYAQVKGEPFTDSLYGGVYDGLCNHGEPYFDLNNNGTWDANLGDTGQGKASDTVKYTVTVTYNRLFPIAKLVGWSSAVTLTATTILKNQPYLIESGAYDYSTAQNRNCPA